MSVRPPHEILGVKRGASKEEVRAAYRRLVLRHHPDANPGDPGAEERFKEIQRAYEALKDPEKASGSRNAPSGRAPGTPPRRGTASGTGSGAQRARSADLEDLLGRLGKGGARERVLRLLGENLKVEVKYSFGQEDGKKRGEGRGPKGSGGEGGKKL